MQNEYPKSAWSPLEWLTGRLIPTEQPAQKRHPHASLTDQQLNQLRRRRAKNKVARRQRVYNARRRRK